MNNIVDVSKTIKNVTFKYSELETLTTYVNKLILNYVQLEFITDHFPLRVSRKLKNLSVELGLWPHSHRRLNDTKLKVCVLQCVTKRPLRRCQRCTQYKLYRRTVSWRKVKQETVTE